MDRQQHRIESEISHADFLQKNGAGELWGWETPAGRLRWQRRCQMLATHLKPGHRVLELGCGTGYFTRVLQKHDIQLVAIDIAPQLIQEAKRTVVAKNVEFAVADAHSLKFSDNSFDVVLGSSVLHHLNVDLALKEVYRVLKPSGRMAFTEPNMLNPQIAVQKNIPVIKRRMGDSEMESAFFKWPLRQKLSIMGFKEIAVEPFDFLHPALPEPVLETAQRICHWLEKMPGVREIAGSLYIQAQK